MLAGAVRMGVRGALAKSVLLLAVACGSRSGLRVDEAGDAAPGLPDAGDGGTGGTGGSVSVPECPGPPGSVHVLDSGSMQPARLGLVQEGVIWGEWHFSARIALTPYSGGASLTLSDDEPSVNGMASDGSQVFFTVQGYGDHDGAVRAISAKGAPKSLLPGLSRPKGVAQFGTAVLSTSGATADTKGSIVRTTKSGGVPSSVTLGLDVPFAVAAGDDGVFFTDLGAAPTLYRAGEQASDPPIPLHKSNLGFTRIAVGGGNVYAVRRWASEDELFTVKTTGGDTKMLMLTMQEIADVTADDAGVFWLVRSRPGDPPEGTLYFAPHTGFPADALAHGSWRPSQVEVDARSAFIAYFQPDGSGGILQICRPDVPTK
jgi:hypothetical protein